MGRYSLDTMSHLIFKSENRFLETLSRKGGGLKWGCSPQFLKTILKLDSSDSPAVEKQMVEIYENPSRKKPMRGNRQGQREVYVLDSYRIYYYYIEQHNFIYFYELSHKNKQKIKNFSPAKAKMLFKKVINDVGEYAKLDSNGLTFAVKL